MIKICTSQLDLTAFPTSILPSNKILDELPKCLSPPQDYILFSFVFWVFVLFSFVLGWTELLGGNLEQHTWRKKIRLELEPVGEVKDAIWLSHKGIWEMLDSV